MISANDLEQGALVRAGSARAHDRAKRARDASLAADDLADVVGRDVELEDDVAVPLGPHDANLVRLVDEPPREVFDELLQSG